MRFWLAVAIAGAAATPAFWRLPDWVGTTFWLVVGYFAVVGVGAGFFAQRRAAIAGGLAVYTGLLIYTAQSYVRQEGDGMDLLGTIFIAGRLAIAVIPYAAIGAVGGTIGGYLRRRLSRARP